MVRPTELEPEWLDASRLADLLFHHEPAMGAFLLETSQEMPTETLPLYRHLKWPHLPRINLPTNELAFNNCAAGEYGCYSMSRKLVGNKSEYNIAFYPVHISKDGYFKIKGGTRKNAEGKDIAIEYEGRAFSAENSSQLHLYVDQADSRTHPFRAGFHFRIKAGDKITSAYGVSERLPQLDEPPQARFEALIALKGNLAYDNTNFRLFDPFSPDDCTELDEQELNLSRFLAGRANRLILANRHLQPNRSIPDQIRQDTFRRLHIKAAFYEIEHGDYKDADNCIELFRDSYIHGFGLGVGDLDLLNTTFKAGSQVSTTIDRWNKDDKKKLLDEVKKLWPKFDPISIANGY